MRFVAASVTKRKVYFPKGDKWVDWWTGQLYEGGKEVEVDAPLNRLPLFARAGAVIPTQPVIQHTGEMMTAPLSLVVVRGADGASSFYEDAGEGYDYARGASRTTTAVQQGGSLKLSHASVYGGARKIGALEFLPGQLPREVRVRDDLALLPTTHRVDGHVFVLLPPTEDVEEFSLVP